VLVTGGSRRSPRAVVCVLTEADLTVLRDFGDEFEFRVCGQEQIAWTEPESTV